MQPTRRTLSREKRSTDEEMEVDPSSTIRARDPSVCYQENTWSTSSTCVHRVPVTTLVNRQAFHVVDSRARPKRHFRRPCRSLCISSTVNFVTHPARPYVHHSPKAPTAQHDFGDARASAVAPHSPPSSMHNFTSTPTTICQRSLIIPNIPPNKTTLYFPCTLYCFTVIPSGRLVPPTRNPERGTFDNI